MSTKYQVQVFNPVTGFVRTVLAEKRFDDSADMGGWFEKTIAADTERWAKPFDYRIVADFNLSFSRAEF